ncbi:tRNA pseudouridine(13) synthase TruD [Marinobacter sp. chi1]|uniref:tRNA pseudouridine synthase D n=1 Tax=Marinobacter suaedae TaxID=3057675 RepID=A0ABT8W0U4_9GAMM|nr:tRNA pseudouridine(13) synthase TruD [Marinobacter sp. chi1]MDO3721854.1 tRNA pseudouridine(13) synthase TruD [Marinobacter sp. chi1]
MTDSSATPRRWCLDWPTSGGGRVATADLKTVPEDFRVDEILDDFPVITDLSEVSGSGEHLCLRLEKSGDNTEYVARELAKLSGCRAFDVGFCGLKDRHAVTRQWFSIYRPGLVSEDEAYLARVAERWQVVGACRSSRKLRRGDHQGNRFVISLRQVSGDRERIDQALARVKGQGAPNYFGPQRFGHDGSNLDRAASMDPDALDSRGRRGKGKKRGGAGASKNVLYFSAARSWIFNQILAARVKSGDWLSPMDGEPGLNGQPGTVTGPLWGDGGTTAEETQARLEWQIAEQYPELLKVFSTTRMKPERRPLVARPADLDWHWLDDDCLQVAFSLAPGQYATTVLSDLFELEDRSLGQHNKQHG